MNFKKKLLILLTLLTFIFPFITYAYSDKVILGGNNIGITVNTKEAIVVGFYKVNGKYIAKEQGVKENDKITHVENDKVDCIDDLIAKINKYIKNNEVNITVLRDGISVPIKLKLVKEGETYKTGLFIKDEITGIGTLTYIDPNTKIYGALGHEITERTTNNVADIKGGKIFKAIITGTVKSTLTKTGEKRAKFDSSEVYGSIDSNTKKGIYGIYSSSIDENKLIDVANPNEIKEGKASIFTVLDGNVVDEFEINIIKINSDSSTKNILFEITDKRLLDMTGGVIKGMSGSPIVQNNKIVGAVTHAIVNDAYRGYGIFITKMLEEGDKES